MYPQLILQNSKCVAMRPATPVLVCLLTPLPCDQVVRLAGTRAEHIQWDGGELQSRPTLHHQDLVVALGNRRKTPFLNKCAMVKLDGIARGHPSHQSGKLRDRFLHVL